MVGEDAVEDLRLVVEGEAQALDAPGRLLLHAPAEGGQALDGLIAPGVQGVEQVVIEVVHAALLQLFGEIGVQLLRAVPALEVEDGHLGGQGEAVSVVALDDGLLGHPFALPFVVDVGGVKVGEAPVQEGVRHGADLLQVHPGLLLGVAQGQAHQAES